MTQRIEGGKTYTQVFDAENRLISVTVDSQTTQFVYDGDGNMVKKIKPDGSYVLYIGSTLEIEKNSGGTTIHTTVYYPAGGAMRLDGTLSYVLGDQLGSASVVLDAGGAITAQTRYYPFGETQVSSGTLPTDKLFTGQRAMEDLGIYFYNARFYSPYLNRWIQPDTIIPGAGNSQAYDRFAYVLNNPVIYTDPSGHKYCDADGVCYDSSNGTNGYYSGSDATIGIQDFISNPMKYVEFYADADEWAYNPLAVNLKRFAENTLHIYAESLLFDYVGENYGTEGLEELDKAHLANILDPGSYDLDLSGYALTVSYFEQQNSSNQQMDVLLSGAVGVSLWQVGTYDELYSLSKPGDELDIHHAPQWNPLSQLKLPNGVTLEYGDCPSIVVPHGLHMGTLNRLNLKGIYDGDLYALLQETETNLVTINTPSGAIGNLKNLWGITFRTNYP